jgi:hypothetical protein
MADDAVALANSIVTAMLDDEDGRAARNLISSIMADMTRDLGGDSLDEAIAELGVRGYRVLLIVEVMASMVVQVIHGAERAGISINLDALASPYDVMSELDDLDESDPEPE